MCPLELENDRDGLGSIGNDEFVDDVGHDSDIEFRIDNDIHGLHMFDVELGVDMFMVLICLR